MVEEVRLYGTWASPYPRRVEMALKLKGVEYQYVEEDLSNKSSDLLKYNPVHKKIPVLLHNGKPIAESLVILEYIDETWTNVPLLPKNPYARAMARFWAKFIDEKIRPTGNKVWTATVEEQKQIFEELRQQLKLLENELRENDFYGGDSVGYLDIVAFCLVYWFQIGEEVLGNAGHVGVSKEENFPVLFKWMKRMRSMDVINDCSPPREKHIAYVKAHFEAATAAASK